VELFTLAANINAEVELSTAFRELAAHESRDLPGPSLLFLNTHPLESESRPLLASLRRIREQRPDLGLVLEIHESAVTDASSMRDFRAELAELEIQLAYDDFGAGQARLIELVEAPPTYLKFDMSLVRDIHAASTQKQRMVRTLVQLVLDFGIVPLAEGIEIEPEGDTCRELGFELAQGFHFGRPAPPPGSDLPPADAGRA
jgi:EAL domain-containing protein (putative c-di-GMP-specific phosphodiesterase class I)